MKRILIISPQEWQHIFISKHNYAIELAKDKDSQVYFLEPLNNKIRFEISVKSLYDNAQVHLIKAYYFFPFVLFFRYKLTKLYDLLIQVIVKRITKKTGYFDEVWLFDANIYKNAKSFICKNGKVIFFPVDTYSFKRAKEIAKNSDLVVSISEVLLNPLQSFNRSALLLNHGLSDIFVRMGYTPPCYNDLNINRLKFGYSGNLMIRQLDRKILSQIIRDNPNTEFHFWGNIESADGKVEHYISEFIFFLTKADNVYLHGTVSQNILADSYQTMDGFLVCYDLTIHNQGNNSHKIIEYLSTGRVVISNYYPMYDQRERLIIMPDSIDNSTMPELFKNVISNITVFNNKDQFDHRRSFALKNTYRSNINQIRKC